MNARVASIDIGTNSTRLLVAEAGADGGPLVTVDRLMRITRLGQGVDRVGALVPEAIERTVAVLREYREVMDRLGVPEGRVRMSAGRVPAPVEGGADAVGPGVGPAVAVPLSVGLGEVEATGSSSPDAHAVAVRTTAASRAAVRWRVRIGTPRGGGFIISTARSPAAVSTPESA